MTDTWPLTLYFDASCPLCATEMHNLRLRDLAGRLRFVDCSPQSFDAAPPGTTHAQLMQQMHAIDARGTVWVGVAAFERAYAAVGLTGVSRALGWRWLRPLLNKLYPHVARHRQRIPRFLVSWVFGWALRRAARHAANQHCASQACQVKLPSRH